MYYCTQINVCVDEEVADSCVSKKDRQQKIFIYLPWCWCIFFAWEINERRDLTR